MVFTRVLAICCKLKHFARCLCSIFKRAMCFHIFFAFFHKKQYCRSKLDDSVTQKKPGGRRRTEFFTHIGAFTQKSFIQRKDFTQKPLLKGTFAHKRPGAFRHRSFYTKKSLHRYVCSQKFLHREAFTQKSFFAQKHCYTASCYIHRGFYTEKSLYKGAFYTQGFLYREVFTLRNFCTRNVLELLHTKFVRQRNLYTENFNTQTRLHADFRYKNIEGYCNISSPLLMFINIY